MEFLSTLANIINILKNSLNWVLRQRGYKIVKFDDFTEETEVVDSNYTSKSSECIKETNAGASFRWSKKYRVGYEKYSEIQGDIRRYFKQSSGALLWIKRTNRKVKQR